ncbi:GH1 family beta-glucosidase [Allostella humosa]|uniref:GH1 family beta-glucosidase n=1 Tax=Stella humosa TaxID=94 RepID=UPI001FEB5141|nr:GH1 family beta-glucosidase [Stella humosa]
MPLWPAEFRWGASTSAYQIEGAATADGKGPSIWDVRSHMPGRITGGDTGDVACDHYHRYREDIALMGEIGLDAYRFSISWPRVLPQGRGQVNPAGLDFYDRLVDGLLAAGIEPWACLYHWDLPQALQDQGGWVARDSAGWFADYAVLIARRLGDRVKRFATFNEPSVFTLFGYVMDWQAPGIMDRASYLAAMHHVNLAHGAAVDVLRDLVPGGLVGAIHNRQPCLPVSQAEADREAAAFFDACWNRAFPDAQILGTYPSALIDKVAPWVKAGDLARICRPVDWLGLNHYSPIYARADPEAILGFGWGSPPEGRPQTDVGWVIDANAFRDTLIDVHRTYRLPIYVTENGYGGTDAPDATGAVQDPERVGYLGAYIHAMGEAMARGADVRGYFVWSLLDNFEWGSGYSQRFGIVHVNYPTQRRTLKSSARWYREHIRTSRVPTAFA